MAKFALVSLLEGRVCQTADSEDGCFEVAGDLVWIECADEVSVEYDYIDKQFIKRPKIMTNYQTARKVGYGEVGRQLGDIYDALQSSNADEALAAWAERQTKLKILFPKGDENQEAVQAAQEEISRRLTEYRRYVEENGLEYGDPDFVMQVANEYIAGTWINPVSGPYKG